MNNFKNIELGDKDLIALSGKVKKIFFDVSRIFSTHDLICVLFSSHSIVFDDMCLDLNFFIELRDSTNNALANKKDFHDVFANLKKIQLFCKENLLIHSKMQIQFDLIKFDYFSLEDSSIFLDFFLINSEVIRMIDSLEKDFYKL